MATIVPLVLLVAVLAFGETSVVVVAFTMCVFVPMGLREAWKLRAQTRMNYILQQRRDPARHTASTILMAQ